MSLLILGGDDVEESTVLKMLSRLTGSDEPSTGRRHRSRKYEAVVVINDQSAEALHHIRRAMELRNATPTLPIMVLTELKPEWSAAEAMVRTSEIEAGPYGSGNLASTVISDYWQGWRTKISDDAITFEYQEAM